MEGLSFKSLKEITEETRKKFESDRNLNHIQEEKLEDILENNNNQNNEFNSMKIIPNNNEIVTLNLDKEIKEYQEEIIKVKNEIEHIEKDSQTIELEKKIKEAKIERKKAENNLYIKKKEFEIMSRMDPDTLNKLLLSEDNSIISNYKGKHFNTKENEKSIFLNKNELNLNNESKLTEKIDINEFPSRLPNGENLAEKYLKGKTEFYNKFTEKDVKELHEEIRKNKENTSESKNIDDYEKLSDDYYKTYYQFLQRQPEAEKKRQEILYNLANAHEMISCLKNSSKINNPKIWNKKPLYPHEESEIKDYIEKKKNLMENKWRIDLESIDKKDITKEIDLYLQTKFVKLSADLSNK